MREYGSGELDEVLRTHGVNMESANRCIERHDSLVTAVQGIIDDCQNDLSLHGGDE